MAITATVGQGGSSTAALVGGDNVEVVKVTVPGPQGIQGIAGATATALSTLADVDSSAVTDGSLLIYSSSASKWTATNTIEATSGTITVSGGNF